QFGLRRTTGHTPTTRERIRVQCRRWPVDQGGWHAVPAVEISLRSDGEMESVSESQTYKKDKNSINHRVTEGTEEDKRQSEEKSFQSVFLSVCLPQCPL